MSSSRMPDKWVVPAGGIESGEEAHETATREVQEEVRKRNFTSEKTTLLEYSLVYVQ